MNLGHRLERWARRTPEQVALRYGDQDLTFRALDDRAGEVAGGLAQIGVAEGDRVAVLSGSDPGFVAAMYGIWKLGAVAVLLNVHLTPNDIRYQLENAGASVLLVGEGDGLSELADTVVAAMEVPPELVPEGMCRGSPRSAIELPDVHIATISYTSGTTGVPKGAAHSHRSLAAQVRMVAVHYDADEDDRLLTMLPLYLLSIFLVGPMLAIEIGAPCRILARYDPLAFIDVVRRDRTTIAAAVPLFFHDLNELPAGQQRVDLSSFRIISCGGAPLAAHVRERFEDRFDLRFVQAYGCTEAPGIVTTDPITGERRSGSVGKPLAHIAVVVEGDDGVELGSGEIGEICLQAVEDGPYAGVYEPMSSYWNMPEATEQALRHGRLHLGDVGYLDDDGYLYLVDRKKDIIIRGGMNIYPKELEKLLEADASVAEAAVVGAAHERYGEIPVAYVRLEPEADATPQELLERTNGQLARYKHLDELVVVDEFPRNALGKILKRELTPVRSTPSSSS